MLFMLKSSQQVNTTNAWLVGGVRGYARVCKSPQILNENKVKPEELLRTTTDDEKR